MPVGACTTSCPPSRTSATASAISTCPDRASPPPGSAATTRSNAARVSTRRRYCPACDSAADGHLPRLLCVEVHQEHLSARKSCGVLGLLRVGAAAEAFDVAPLALALHSPAAGGGGGNGRAAGALDVEGV